VLPWEPRRTRRQPSANRRTIVTVLETLESRRLLANSGLGYSLPDLRVTGSAGAVASWGGQLAVTANVQNIGSTSINEPLSLAPGSTSTTDAPASDVAVYLSTRPHTLAGAYKLGTLTAPALSQNSTEQVSGSFALPSRPIGFPRAGGRLYVFFVANPNNSILEYNSFKDQSPAVPVKVVGRYLPLLQATGLSLPPTMQPGDTIQPSFSIANYGTAPTFPQGNVQVALVASVDPTFTLGSSIVALYNIGNVASLSNTPIQSYYRSGKVNVRNATLTNLSSNNNVVSVTGSPVTLPTSPSVYYLGLVIDPYNKLKQLPHSGNPFQLIRMVGPASSGLPPAGTISTGGGSTPAQFPSLPSGNLVGVN